MRPPLRSLASIRRRLARVPRAARGLGLGRAPAALGRLLRALPPVPGLGRASRLWHRLGPLRFAAVVTLAGAAALVVVASSSRSSGAPSPEGPVLLAAAAAELVTELEGADGGGPRRGDAAHYRRTLRTHASAKEVSGFVPLYREAERVFGVNWLLLASIHRQETAFSKSPSTYHGLNPFGCCAGPMQFNVTNGPVSTWESYRNAHRRGRRPARYPHPTRRHPSIYDDFDAIMAAGKLLRDSGAGRALDAGAWSAAFSYYGHDLYGITYANQVLARAENWSRNGFCPDCEPDAGLVAEFEQAYGAEIRRQMTAEERLHEKQKKKRKRRRGDKGEDERAERRKRRDAARERALRRSLKQLPAQQPSGNDRVQKPARPRPKRAPAVSKPAPPPSAPPTTAPQAPAQECAPLLKLLGCKK